MPTTLQRCIILLLLCCACSTPHRPSNQEQIPVIGFIDFVEDVTLAKARLGFSDALRDNGYSDSAKTLEIIYRNAQGDQPTLLQAVDYLKSRHPQLIATNTTLATINAVQRNREIPVFMMVAPRPDIAGLTDASGKAPAHLFGVYETLDYIDTSVALITRLFPEARKAGTIYSQSESQSVDALNRLKAGCAKAGITLEAIPVTNSSETQLITRTLLAKGIDVFFALPDNVIFSSFETIVKACDEKNVPVMTSEEGLVSRGALASFGADMYHWGYQSGEQAATFLKTGTTKGLRPEIVKRRRRTMNRAKAERYLTAIDTTFTIIP